MYNAGKIIIGLLIFIAVISFPFWYDAADGTTAAAPKLEIITTATQCVAPTDYMRSSHMNLLDEWRDEVVRGGARYMDAPDGKRYEMSLTNTCLDCHSNKAEFCDRCHNYLGVEPYCWDCHIVPEEK